MLQEKDKPQLFADTSHIPDIEKLMRLGIFSGITTNPLIVARYAGNTEPMAYYKNLAEKYPNVPISIQLLDYNESTLLDEAHKYSAIGPNIVIKVPMFGDGRGLTVSSALNKEGIPTNVTGLMNAEQLLLAILSNPNPTYVSLFFNRIKDGKGNPIDEISHSRQLIDAIGSRSQIITGSIRNLIDVREALTAGSDIVTIPPDMVWKMVTHPQTELFIERSQSDWEKFLASQN